MLDCEKLCDPALGMGKGIVWGLRGTAGVGLRLFVTTDLWVPRKSQFWGPWAAQRPGTSGSQSWTPQTPLDVAEELRTEWELYLAQGEGTREGGEL